MPAGLIATIYSGVALSMRLARFGIRQEDAEVTEADAAGNAIAITLWHPHWAHHEFDGNDGEGHEGPVDEWLE